MSLIKNTGAPMTYDASHPSAIQSHTLYTKAVAVVLISCALLLGCSDSGNSSADKTVAESKAAMPGMKMGDSNSSGAMVRTVTFSAAQIQHGGVRWDTVAMTTAAATAIVPGQVVPDEDRTARLGAPARGRVLAVRVQAGDRVTVGQVLVTLESTDAGTAQADVAKATAEVSSRRAQAKYARSARERAARLLTLKAIPRQDYERAIEDDEFAQSALTGANAELRRANSTASQLGAAASSSGEIVIRSPLRGVVLARTADPGAVVDAGTPLIVVTDPTTLWLAIDAPEQSSALFKLRDQLHFTVPAFPVDTFTARVASIGAGLDPDTRTLPVRGVIANRDARLKPAMLANVSISGGKLVAADIIPDDAVQLLQDTLTVFLARPDGNGGAVFTRRTVTVISRRGGYAAISKGLSAGDIVVTKGAFAVKAEFAKSSMPKMEM